MSDTGREFIKDILLRAVGRDGADTAYAAFCRPPSVSVRLNPFKVQDPEAFVKDRFGEAERVPWNEYGFILAQRPVFTLDPSFHAGCYYVQDSSAMAVGHLFRDALRKLLTDNIIEVPGDDCKASVDAVGSSGKAAANQAEETLFSGKKAFPANMGRPLRVLDLCAAPGGKTTDLAASLRLALGDGFMLTANEVIRSRASVLAANAALWGDPNVVVTSADPKAFSGLQDYFDIIVADVPCSGEGMFRKDEGAVREWSEENVRLCAARQKRILADVWPSLREGGILVYSTCTFEEAENDSIIDWCMDSLGAELYGFDYSSLPGVIPTRRGGLLVPGFVKGEGQFVAACVKNGAGEKCVSKPEYNGRKSHGSSELAAKNDRERFVPEQVAGQMASLDFLRPLSVGVRRGEFKGKDFIPDADWALSLALPENEYPRVEVDRQTALKYLHRDSIALPDAPKGLILVCFEGCPLGFAKNLGSRCNNLYPKSRRILMDIQ